MSWNSCVSRTAAGIAWWLGALAPGLASPPAFAGDFAPVIAMPMMVDMANCQDGSKVVTGFWVAGAWYGLDNHCTRDSEEAGADGDSDGEPAPPRSRCDANAWDCTVP